MELELDWTEEESIKVKKYLEAYEKERGKKINK